MTCPDFRTLVDLRDGELAERVALELRAHVANCQSCGAESRRLDALCRGVAAPVASTGSLSVSEVMAALDQRPAPAERPAWARPALLALAASLSAVVAAGALWSSRPQEGFAARGRGLESADPLQRLFVEPLAGEPLRRVARGEVVPASVRFAATYRNPSQKDAHLLLFVLDSRSQVHWIYPAYRDEADDPVAVRLPASSDGVLGETVGFDDLAAGDALIVSVVSSRSTRVKQIEALAAPSQASVERLFQGAAVRATPIVVATP